MTADDLTAALQACAAGIYPPEAGVTLLISGLGMPACPDIAGRVTTGPAGP